MEQKAKATTVKAKGTYGIKVWDEKTWDGKDPREQHGAKLTYAKIVQDYHGDFEGEAEIRLLMTYLDDNNATYLGLQKMIGRLGDRSGSFIIQVNGIFESGAATSTFKVVPGSGTGDLRGLQGEGETVARHGDAQPYTLEYSFE